MTSEGQLQLYRSYKQKGTVLVLIIFLKRADFLLPQQGVPHGHTFLGVYLLFPWGVGIRTGHPHILRPTSTADPDLERLRPQRPQAEERVSCASLDRATHLVSGDLP